jgi:hypothetical protein
MTPPAVSLSIAFADTLGVELDVHLARAQRPRGLSERSGVLYLQFRLCKNVDRGSQFPFELSAHFVSYRGVRTPGSVSARIQNQTGTGASRRVPGPLLALLILGDEIADDKGPKDVDVADADVECRTRL